MGLFNKIIPNSTKDKTDRNKATKKFVTIQIHFYQRNVLKDDHTIAIPSIPSQEIFKIQSQSRTQSRLHSVSVLVVMI